MNKVTTVNLNGNAYQLEESAYDALRAYLDQAARRLEGNPDKDEIIADIEQAIAEKFRAVLGTFKTVVTTREVEKIIAEMGPVQGETGATGEPAPGEQTGPGPTGGGPAPGGGEKGAATPKRLYKIYDGAMLSGVCNGLGAYFNVDVTLVRIAFVVLSFVWGAGFLVYLMMAFIVPTAHTPEERAAAQGHPSTAEEFIRRAKAGYYEGLKNFHDKQARREWKRNVKIHFRGWKRDFQREMHEHAHQWQQNWSPPPAPHPRAWLGLGFTLMILGWVRLLCFGLLAYSVYSLVTKGGVFGVLLPADIPLWVGVVFLLVAYQFLTWPIKVMKYSCYWPGRPHWGYHPGCSGPLDGLVWLAFLVLVVWLADHYIPQVHEALQNLPPVIHRVVDDVKEWWTRK